MKLRIKGFFATFVEMKTRFYITISMKDSMFKAVQQLIQSLPKEALKSFTSDNGKKFACYKEIEDYGIDFYFSEPYSACKEEVMKTQMDY